MIVVAVFFTIVAAIAGVSYYFFTLLAESVG